MRFLTDMILRLREKVAHFFNDLSDLSDSELARHINEDGPMVDLYLKERERRDRNT